MTIFQFYIGGSRGGYSTWILSPSFSDFHASNPELFHILYQLPPYFLLIYSAMGWPWIIVGGKEPPYPTTSPPIFLKNKSRSFLFSVAVGQIYRKKFQAESKNTVTEFENWWDCILGARSSLIFIAVLNLKTLFYSISHMGRPNPLKKFWISQR